MAEYTIKNKVIDEGRGIVQRTVEINNSEDKLIFTINTTSSYMVDFQEASIDFDTENSKEEPDEELLTELFIDLVKAYKGLLKENYRKLQKMFDQNALDLTSMDCVSIVAGADIGSAEESQNPKA